MYILYESRCSPNLSIYFQILCTIWSALVLLIYFVVAMFYVLLFYTSMIMKYNAITIIYYYNYNYDVL